MKKLVVFYSLHGNTRNLALTIAREVGADVLELQPKKDLDPSKSTKFFWGGMQVMFRKKPELQPFDKNPEDYDLIFIGTPVWVGTFTPVFRTFFEKVNFANKKIALFCSYESSGDRAIQNLKEALKGNEFVDSMTFRTDAGKAKEANAEKAKKWVENIEHRTKN